MALEGVFGNMGGKRKKEKGSFCCGIGERSPHTHDMNMEGRKEHGGKGRKEHWRGKERKGKEICQDFAVFSQAGVRQVHVYLYVYLYLKSRNHDLLKELDGNYGIIEGASLMSR